MVALNKSELKQLLHKQALNTLTPDEQQRLDEYIATLSTDMDRASAVRAASAQTGVLDPNALSSQRQLITQLRHATREQPTHAQRYRITG